MATGMTGIIIAKGPHLLWKPAGRHNEPGGVAGITVRRTDPEDMVERLGFAREWSLNLRTLGRPAYRTGYREMLEMTEEEYDGMLDALERIEREG